MYFPLIHKATSNLYFKGHCDLGSLIDSSVIAQLEQEIAIDKPAQSDLSANQVDQEILANMNGENVQVDQSESDDSGSEGELIDEDSTGDEDEDRDEDEDSIGDEHEGRDEDGVEEGPSGKTFKPGSNQVEQDEQSGEDELEEDDGMRCLSQ